MKHSDVTIDRLVADLAPVRARRAWHDAAWLGGIMAVELALVAVVMPVRADLDTAIHGAMFWWKLLGSAGIAVAAALALVALVVPGARSGQLRWAALAGLIVVLAGALLGAGGVELAHTLDWREGLMCVGIVEAYALPVWAAAFLLARRGAPTRPRLTAIAAGLAGAAWGAAAFALWCPHDDALYVVVWYGIALALGAGMGALLTRWLHW